MPRQFLKQVDQQRCLPLQFLGPRSTLVTMSFSVRNSNSTIEVSTYLVRTKGVPGCLRK
jgi:hypothetical protein